MHQESSASQGQTYPPLGGRAKVRTGAKTGSICAHKSGSPKINRIDQGRIIGRRLRAIDAFPHRRIMMGHRQVDQAALFYEFSLETHVPADHRLRSIRRATGLSLPAPGRNERVATFPQFRDGSITARTPCPRWFNRILCARRRPSSKAGLMVSARRGGASRLYEDREGNPGRKRLNSGISNDVRELAEATLLFKGGDAFRLW